MPVNYINRKGQAYTLYRGQTKTGKPRYYFGRSDQSKGEPVTEFPSGFTISESINGIVSLVKERPLLITPVEVAAVEEEVKLHPSGRRYRIATKHDYIEIYEQIGPNFDSLANTLQAIEGGYQGLTSKLQSLEERFAQYTPVLRFILLDPTQRQFGAKRMCYRSSVDGWLELTQTGPIAKLAHTLIPTLGTDQFYELW
ncbi:MAG TPA: hypothetical protein VL485_29450 [Ktedonobacteraceae bacterium]|jgi:hypothetical protein|nr:hypothetical protein [Ktedonobacteraceae bacterium]